jgi:hypothetical protein
MRRRRIIKEEEEEEEGEEEKEGGSKTKEVGSERDHEEEEGRIPRLGHQAKSLQGFDTKPFNLSGFGHQGLGVWTPSKEL